MKANVYCLFVDSSCKVNEALMVITPLLLSTEDTGHGASRGLLSEDRSTLDWMEKILSEMTNEQDRQKTGGPGNEHQHFQHDWHDWHRDKCNKQTWLDWQEAQKERIADISKDMQTLQEEDFIPEAGHEHTTWTTSTVFLLFLSFIISLS